VASLQGKSFGIIIKEMKLYIESLGLKFIVVSYLVSAVCIWPLRVGLVHIMHQQNNGIEPTVSDFFVAYQGENFKKYIGYFLVYSLIFTLSSVMGFLGSIFQIGLVIYTLLVVPVMLVENCGFSDAFAKALRINSQHRITILLLAIIACAMSYSGVLLFGVGLLFTWPFSTIICYAIYNCSASKPTDALNKP
jgi:hypothetical protein